MSRRHLDEHGRYIGLRVIIILCGDINPPIIALSAPHSTTIDLPGELSAHQGHVSGTGENGHFPIK